MPDHRGHSCGTRTSKSRRVNDNIPTIDISRWRSGGVRKVASAVDEALQRVGFILVTGHGVAPTLARDARAVARAFFAQPDAVKQRYSVAVGGRGWLPPGAEAAAYAEGTQTPPDLKETFRIGSDTTTGDPHVDQVWFAPNVWPAEEPRLQPVLTKYCAAMRVLADELLALFAEALGLPNNPFADIANKPTWALNVNHYPPVSLIGRPQSGQYRSGPHTDFGTVTILDREPGAGGLQVYSNAHGWCDAPYDPDALTVNIGDLLEHWSGRRWPAGRHRVLPPQPHAPDEDLVSLIYFYEANPDAVVTPLAPPIGRVIGLAPVMSSTFIKERLDAITIAHGGDN
jgi:isopenicillin N synthase-like dioxygenase